MGLRQGFDDMIDLAGSTAPTAEETARQEWLQNLPEIEQVLEHGIFPVKFRDDAVVDDHGNYQFSLPASPVSEDELCRYIADKYAAIYGVNGPCRVKEEA